jgi:hypothetical protein
MKQRQNSQVWLLTQEHMTFLLATRFVTCAAIRLPPQHDPIG